jgi:hypothetical protein
MGASRGGSPSCDERRTKGRQILLGIRRIYIHTASRQYCSQPVRTCARAIIQDCVLSIDMSRESGPLGEGLVTVVAYMGPARKTVSISRDGPLSATDLIPVCVAKCRL